MVSVGQVNGAITGHARSVETMTACIVVLTAVFAREGHRFVKAEPVNATPTRTAVTDFGAIPENARHVILRSAVVPNARHARVRPPCAVRVNACAALIPAHPVGIAKERYAMNARMTTPRTADRPVLSARVKRRPAWTAAACVRAHRVVTTSVVWTGPARHVTQMIFAVSHAPRVQAPGHFARPMVRAVSSV